MSLTQIILLLCLLLTNFSVSAVTRIAILDFELKDLTLAPGIPAELSRTASIRPLLEHELGSAGYQLVNIPSAAQQTAQSGGVGYFCLTTPMLPDNWANNLAQIMCWWADCISPVFYLLICWVIWYVSTTAS